MTQSLTIPSQTKKIVPFVRDACFPPHHRQLEHTNHHGEGAIMGCVLETQNMDQCLSQAMKAIVVIVNTSSGDGDLVSYTSLFLCTQAGHDGVARMKEGCSTAIL